MSDALHLRDQSERTARVWQPSDFLLPDGPGERFVARRWEGAPAKVFTPQADPVEVLPLALPPVEEPAAGQMPPPTSTPEPAQAEAAQGVSAQAIEDARVEAYAQGLAHGRQESQAQARAQAEEAASHQHAALRERIAALEASLEDLRQSPERLHEPLKRLALHLAEQLVLGELTQSPQAIERLVSRCVEELGAAQGAPVVIELCPDDLALLQPWLARQDAAEAEGSRARPWVLQPSDELRPGSVRASANDAVVSDLIEHRLDDLARQLRVDAQRVARQSALQPQRLAARRAEVDTVLDAHPRMAEAPRSARFAPVVDAAVTEAVLADEAAAPASADPTPGLPAEDAHLDADGAAGEATP